MNKILKISLWVCLFLVFIYIFSVVAITNLNPEETRTVNADIHRIHIALRLFKLDVGRYPTKEEGLSILWDIKKGLALSGYRKSGYLEAVQDPWGNDYQYLTDKQEIKLWSVGDTSSGDGIILHTYTQ